MAAKHIDTVFAERLAPRRAELEELFHSLYGDSPELAHFERVMAKAHADRPADLKSLDVAREQDPQWYRRGDMFGMTM